MQGSHDSDDDDEGEHDEGKTGTWYAIRMAALKHPQNCQTCHNVHERGVCRSRCSTFTINNSNKTTRSGNKQLTKLESGLVGADVVGSAQEALSNEDKRYRTALVDITDRPEDVK